MITRIVFPDRTGYATRSQLSSERVPETMPRLHRFCDARLFVDGQESLTSWKGLSSGSSVLPLSLR